LEIHDRRAAMASGSFPAGALVASPRFLNGDDLGQGILDVDATSRANLKLTNP